MTDTKLLKEKIKEKGYKIGYIADKLDLSRAGLYLKINGTNEFYASEIQTISNLLNLNTKEKENIFFN